MRIGIRLTFSGLVLTSIMVSAIGVHVLWWRTAEANSRALADTINSQIVSTVEKELTTISTEARAAHTAIRTLFVQHVLETREAGKREFVFLSQLQSQQDISWVAFGWPDGTFFAAHKLGDLGLEMMEISPVDGAIKRRIDQYGVVVGDIQFEKRRFENVDYVVTDGILHIPPSIAIRINRPGTTHRALRSKMAKQLFLEYAARLDKQAAIDGLV